MGATLSSLTEGFAGGAAAGSPGLGDIPENCVASVFIHLTPPEICNLARLNRAFRGAASSDSVWDKKLPRNYQDLLDLLPEDRYLHLSKKGVFALLSNPIYFDDGTKAVWLDRVTGNVCMSVSARGLAITGVDDRRYWSWIPTDESRFRVIAYVQQIWWFEVYGSTTFPFPTGVYSVYFRLYLGKFTKKLGRRICLHEHTHGWTIKPVRFDLTTSDGQQASSESLIDDPHRDEAKRGCWIKYKVGEFTVRSSSPIMEVRFSMKQIDCTHSKGGLCVDSVFILPSSLNDRKDSS